MPYFWAGAFAFFPIFIVSPMPYPVQLLTTVADCDAVLASAQSELQDFQLRESVLGRRDEKTSESAASAAAELTSLNATIALLTPLIPTLPAGSKIRFSNETSLRQATHRREDLVAARPTSGPVAALVQALDLRQVQVQTAEIQRCISEVTARRAAL